MNRLRLRCPSFRVLRVYVFRVGCLGFKAFRV